MSTPSASEIAHWLEFAMKAARAAGSLTLERFGRQSLRVERKPDRSYVTDADRDAEALLRHRVEHAFPDHGFLGEELGETPARSPARWIADPIDGTYSFVCGVPLFANLLALEFGGAVVVGVIHLPALGETIAAGVGLGCTWNGRAARVSSVSDLADARGSTTNYKLHEQHGTLAAHARLRSAIADERGWPDAYAYALLATGRVDLVVDPQMSIWDTAALMPCVTEAGGRLTNWAGVETHTSQRVLATNGLLHDAALQQLREFAC